jgi:glycosyltransferase involved in cell wall biosynthesis
MLNQLVFVTSTLPRHAGDLQAPFVLEQALAWAQARPDVQITILAPHDSSARRRESICAVTINRFRYFVPERLQRLAYPAILPNLKANWLLALQVPFFILSEYFSVLRAVKRHKPDLLYAHWVVPQGLIAYWGTRRRGIRYVLHNHSSNLRLLVRLGMPGRCIAKILIRNAVVLFCTNTVQRELALSLFDVDERAGVAGKVVVMPMGVMRPEAGGEADRHSDQAISFRYRFGTIARLTRKKGIDFLIAAASRASGKLGECSVGIAGDGEDRQRLVELAAGGDAHFLGFMAAREKWQFFEDCRFMVFSSKATGGDVEGLPVSLLEALAMGKTVIASRDTNVQLLPEWPEIRDCIEFVEDPADIDRLAEAMDKLGGLSGQEVARRAARLQQVMGRYLWPRLIHEYLAVIDGALAQAG